MLPLTHDFKLMAHMTNKERQSNYKSKMYEAGFKRIYFWVKNEPSKGYKLSKETFERKVEQLSINLSPTEQGKLYALIIKIIEGKKEVLKLRKRDKSHIMGAKGGNKGRG